MFCNKFQLHLFWDAKLVHGVLYISVLQAYGSGIGQKGLAPHFRIHLVLPLFWGTSGISFTGEARYGLQKEGGRKHPCLTCTLIWAQDICEQLRFWNALRYLLRYLCQSILFTELFLVSSGRLCWGSRLKLSSSLSWLFSSQPLPFFLGDLPGCRVSWLINWFEVQVTWYVCFDLSVH